MQISRKTYEDLIAITQRAYPYEAAGYLFKDNTVVIEAQPKERSEAHFGDIDPVWVAEQTKKHGEPSSLFHSHPGAAFISQMDYLFMLVTNFWWRGIIWLVMSSDYELKAWKLEGEKVIEVVIEIE